MPWKKKRNYKWWTQTIWIFAGNGEAGRVGIFTEMTLYSARIEIVYFQAFHYSKKWVVSKALFYQIIFNKCFSCLVASHPSGNRQQRRTRKKDRNTISWMLSFKNFWPKMFFMNLQSPSVPASKEIIHQQRYLNQNLTESHLNIKWQKTCLMSGMKNGWHLFMIFFFTLDTFLASN